jgi:hypothetical protein
MTGRLLAALLLTLGSTSMLGAQTVADSAAIHQVALDYVEGWYDGEAGRMERALHPELVKRIVERSPEGASVLETMNAADLVGFTGRNRPTPAGERRAEVRILEIDGDLASIRVTMQDWVDYMHLARFDGSWRIVNVLWKMLP